MIQRARRTARRHGYLAPLGWLLGLGLACGPPRLVTEVHAQDLTETTTQTVAIGARGRLDLSNVSGRISVVARDGDEASITATKRVRRAASDAEARALLSGVSVEIRARAGRVVVRTRHADRSRRDGWVSVDYTVEVPVGVTLELQSVSGDIEVRGVGGDTRVQAVSGDLRFVNAVGVAVAKTVSGDIEIEGSSASGDATLGTVSGDVRVRRLASPRLDIDSVSGDLDLDDVEADRVEVGTVSGDVRFRGRLTRDGRYDFHSHSGTLRLVLGGAGFDLDAQTFSGELDNRLTLAASSDTPLRGRRRRNRTLRGTVGEGGALVEVRTFSGDVRLERQ